jgi:hypothetical protein
MTEYHTCMYVTHRLAVLYVKLNGFRFKGCTLKTTTVF